MSKVYVPVPGSFLWPPSVKLDLVYGPHGSLHVLQTHETFVQTQVVSDGVLEESRHKFQMNVLCLRRFMIHMIHAFVFVPSM